MKRFALTVLLALGTGFAVSTASATPTPIFSHAGGGTCTLLPGSGSTGACTTVEITPHPAWQTNNPNPPDVGGNWVSYADTGYNGTVLAPYNGSSSNPDGKQAIFQIEETFTGHKSIDLWIWADDTAEVFLDGVSVNLPNFTDATCANGPLGCQPQEFFRLQDVVGSGDHTIKIVAYQFGSLQDTRNNPFGVLYAGTVDVPEPATLALVGAGLFGLGLVRRRRKTA